MLCVSHMHLLLLFAVELVTQGKHMMALDCLGAGLSQLSDFCLFGGYFCSDSKCFFVFSNEHLRIFNSVWSLVLEFSSALCS